MGEFHAVCTNNVWTFAKKGTTAKAMVETQICRACGLKLSQILIIGHASHILYGCIRKICWLHLKKFQLGQIHGVWTVILRVFNYLHVLLRNIFNICTILSYMCWLCRERREQGKHKGSVGFSSTDLWRLQ